MRILAFLFSVLLSGIYPILVHGQKKYAFRDSLDQKLDLSDWVISAHGFIPVPYLITEPALGGIGGALAPVFIQPNSPYIDTVDGQVIRTRAKPNIYAVGFAYTANKSWLLLIGAAGTIKKWRANYRIGTALADINMNFYKEGLKDEEKSFEFNISTIPFTGQFTKQLGRSPWSVGLNYLFLNTELKRTNAEFHTPKEIKSIISRLGLLVDYDNRDNVFTPDKGFRWNTMIASSAEFLGSDYEFTSAFSAIYWYVPVSRKIIAGLRTEYQQIWGDAPFYMHPFLNLRGIPVMRYQGITTALAETEWRWDFKSRYSLITFGGAAKAISKGDSFGESAWRITGGAGFRYLIARKLKLRMGLDLARGPEQWAYYIVFGTNWIR